MRVTHFGWTALFALVPLFLSGGRVDAEDWPQFRGPNCSGISPSEKDTAR